VLAGGERLAGVDVNAAAPGAPVLASIRPERIVAHFAAPPDPRNVLRATVTDVLYFGDHLRLRCAVAGQPPATVKVPLGQAGAPRAGQPVWLQLPPAFLRVYA